MLMEGVTRKEVNNFRKEKEYVSVNRKVVNDRMQANEPNEGLE